MRAVNAVVRTGNTSSVFKARKATLASDRKINFKDVFEKINCPAGSLKSHS